MNADDRSEPNSRSAPDAAPNADADERTHPDRRSTDREAEDDTPTIVDGRYVYCVVLVDDEDAVPAFETTGVEGEPVSLVTADGLGAVVHECDEIYDSADVSRIRRWLVRHQSVVDDAADVFGTPLPFQFDTIIRGGDRAVRGWLSSERDRLREILESLAGHWEYRVEVVRTDPVDDATLEARDERLSTLRERIDDADEGAGFLLEKQYERRVQDVRSNRRAATAADLRDRLAEHAREVHELERSPSTTLASGDDGAARRTTAENEREEQEQDRTREREREREQERETICRLTILAHQDEEGTIGSVLDDVAAEPGLEVRFTGPWPPYTFVPELGGDGTGDSDDRTADSTSSSTSPR